MYIPKEMVKNGEHLLEQNEDAILEVIGKELYDLEEGESGQHLGRHNKRTKDDLRRKALKYINSKKKALQIGICPVWKANLEKISYSGELIIALGAIVGDSLRLPQSQVNLALVVSVIIIKWGVGKFCE